MGLDRSYRPMEHVIIATYGRWYTKQNTLDILYEMLRQKLPQNDLKIAYLDYQSPNLREMIELCISEGASQIIIFPYLLEMTPEDSKIVSQATEEFSKKNPEVKIICTEPIGFNEKIVQIIAERINISKFGSPKDIEHESFNILSQELDLSDVPPEQVPIFKRVIHATADFEYRDTLKFHPMAVRTGIEAIRSGKDILTDVAMVQVGINQSILERWGGKVICKVSDDQVIKASSATGRTRAELGIEEGFTKNVGIVAVGNSPTALIKAIDLVKGRKDILVIGVPVGFVKALDSKIALSKQDFPFITNLSRKGGSSVAVAIVNALLRMTGEP